MKENRVSRKVKEVADVFDLFVVQGGSAAAQLAKEGARKAGRAAGHAAARVETALLRGTNGSAASFEKLGKQSSSETTVYRMPQKPQ